MTTIDLDEFETPSKVGQRLGVSPERVRQLLREGRLPCVWTPLGRLIPRAAVEVLVAQRREEHVYAK